MRTRAPEQHRSIIAAEKVRGITRDSRAVVVDGMKRYLCRMCQGVCPGNRTSFCSGEDAKIAADGRIFRAGTGCAHEWRLRADNVYMRWHVAARDRSVCASCGTNCDALRASLRALRAWSAIQIGAAEALGFAAFDSSCQHPLWQADHIVAVTMGGGGCGLDNMRTLCLPCHRKETGKLAAVRAARAKQRPGQQSLF